MEKIKQWGIKLIKFIWKYKFTLLTLILLFGIIRLVAGNYNNKHWLILLSFYFLLNVLSKVKTYISIPVTIVVSCLLAGDVYFPVVYKEKLSFGIMEALVQANAAEVNAMFFSVLIKFLFIATLVATAFFLSEKELKWAKPGVKISLLIFASYWLILIPVYSISKIKSDKETASAYQLAPAYTVYHFISYRFPLLFRSSALYFAYKEQVAPVDSYRYAERIIPSFVTLDSVPTGPKKIYIVLGESATRSHFSLYGYEVETTPFVDRLAKENKAFKYYDGICGAPMTQVAIPLAITYAVPGNEAPMYENKNLIEMMKNVGYETLWISSHGIFGVADTKIGVFASVSDLLYYANRWPPDDIALVEKMKEWLNKDKKQFIVLHVDGSHFEYKERYDQIDAQHIAGEGVVVDYDRTIHHTDRVLEALYQTIKDDESSVMLYFSDHGEIIGKGHGFVNEGAEQFEIPFLTLHANYPKIDSLMLKYQDEKGRFNSMNVINVLTELVGFKYPDEYHKKAVEHGKNIQHADGMVYKYEDIKNKK